MLALLWVAPLQGYEIARDNQGQPLDPTPAPIHLQVEVEDALVHDDDRGALGARAACWRAALTWAAPDEVPLAFVRQLPDDPAPPGGRARFDVRALDPWPTEYGSALATVAFTVVELDSTGSQIRAAEVLLNRQGFAFSTSDQPRRLDVEGTVAHELGHGLALEHSCGESWGQYPDCAALPTEVRDLVEAATMYPAASQGNLWQRDLGEDDLAGLRALYGDGASHPLPQLAARCTCLALQPQLWVASNGDLQSLVLYGGGGRAQRHPGAAAASCHVDAEGCWYLVGVDDDSLLLDGFDLELRALGSDKTAVIFDMVCAPCAAADGGVSDRGPTDHGAGDDGMTPPPPPGCGCGATAPTGPGSALALLLGWGRRRRRC